MIILEDDLEKLMVSSEPTELTYEGYQELSQRLSQLQPHMQASSGCWEETVSQVDHMLRRANAASGGFGVLLAAQPGLRTSGENQSRSSELMCVWFLPPLPQAGWSVCSSGVPP